MMRYVLWIAFNVHLKLRSFASLHFKGHTSSMNCHIFCHFFAFHALNVYIMCIITHAYHAFRTIFFYKFCTDYESWNIANIVWLSNYKILCDIVWIPQKNIAEGWCGVSKFAHWKHLHNSGDLIPLCSILPQKINSQNHFTVICMHCVACYAMSNL